MLTLQQTTRDIPSTPVSDRIVPQKRLPLISRLPFLRGVWQVALQPAPTPAPQSATMITPAPTSSRAVHTAGTSTVAAVPSGWMTFGGAAPKPLLASTAQQNMPAGQSAVVQQQQQAPPPLLHQAKVEAEGDDLQAQLDALRKRVCALVNGVVCYHDVSCDALFQPLTVCCCFDFFFAFRHRAVLADNQQRYLTLRRAIRAKTKRLPVGRRLLRMRCMYYDC